MKSHHFRNAHTHHDSDLAPLRTRPAGEREVDFIGLRSLPVIPYRRYPSLSDDGQPYFPRLREKARQYIRAIALLALVAIIAVLAAVAWIYTSHEMTRFAS